MGRENNMNALTTTAAAATATATVLGNLIDVSAIGDEGKIARKLATK